MVAWYWLIVAWIVGALFVLGSPLIMTWVMLNLWSDKLAEMLRFADENDNVTSNDSTKD